MGATERLDYLESMNAALKIEIESTRAERDALRDRLATARAIVESQKQGEYYTGAFRVEGVLIDPVSHAALLDALTAAEPHYEQEEG